MRSAESTYTMRKFPGKTQERPKKLDPIYSEAEIRGTCVGKVVRPINPPNVWGMIVYMHMAIDEGAATPARHCRVGRSKLRHVAAAQRDARARP